MFVFEHLDARTRQLMLEEATADQFSPTEYYSRRLTAVGIAEWPQLLRNAISAGNCETLAGELRTGGRLKSHEERRTKKGTTVAVVPVNAADVLAQGELNRYYIRAVCLRAIEQGETQVVVCRGRHSDSPRAESEAIIGKGIDAKSLRDDIRDHPGEAGLLGVPLVNSGLTVRLRGNI